MSISNVRYLLVGSGIRRQPEKNTPHLTFLMASNYCIFFHSGGFVLVPLHFHLAGNQSGYTTRGYISGAAVAESLTALLDGDGFILGRGKAVALQVMALCPWTAILFVSFFAYVSSTHLCQLSLLLGRRF
ncbi:hypothetical protein EDB82DRAFT_17852 [Fusarium venenatum]|uniref:uncharacterized protein n=1 Tax=Fusarium venenatum TaxID=56646 RepID=UPI001D93F201|nr:hypothetical protein EDB82DRAFT_17852 [Fusarium venenatum]